MQQASFTQYNITMK